VEIILAILLFGLPFFIKGQSQYKNKSERYENVLISFSLNDLYDSNAINFFNTFQSHQPYLCHNDIANADQSIEKN